MKNHILRTGFSSSLIRKRKKSCVRAICGIHRAVHSIPVLPVDYFDREYPWSVSTGETLEASDIHVTLTREADGKEWTFSEEKSDGLFSVDNDDCGQDGCVSFRPELSGISEYADGDVFHDFAMLCYGLCGHNSSAIGFKGYGIPRRGVFPHSVNQRNNITVLVAGIRKQRWKINGILRRVL